PRHENDGEKGFSLAEVMVAAGLLSVLSLALVHITQNQAVVQKRAEASSEINTISNTITQNLLNSLACEETLTLGSTISEGMDIAEIKNRRGDTLFNKVDKYGNRQISINDITLNNLSVGPLANGSRFGEANIIVTFEKLSKLIKGIKLIQKTFPVKISLSGANALLGCYSATENAVQTATEKSCESIGGTYNSASNVCDLAAFNPLDPLSASKAVSSQSQEDWYNNMMTASLSPYVKLIGDTMTGKLQVNADIETNSRLCINGECRTTFTAQLCPTGEVVSKVFTNGTVACVDITCPSESTFFVGINASGAPKCKAFPTNTCSANQFVSKVDSDGTVHCSALPAGTNIDCGAGAIQKIDAAGNATCVNFP
ncbi:MAG: prepilin-type N-terminal cleavage/methylation domain-containing protein, partial [Bacteriovoracaceae bacterium]|nr:prepilin-type N-terminal cleavage/methylation domain-containing protein [Bacteriovoracaceae bacterium]